MDGFLLQMWAFRFSNHGIQHHKRVGVQTDNFRLGGIQCNVAGSKDELPTVIFDNVSLQQQQVGFSTAATFSEIMTATK